MSDRYQGSRERLERARHSLPGGVSSPFRAKAPVPLYFQDAEGPRLLDVDGNRYIDYALAWGPLILGHRHPALVEAMSEAAVRPHNYGAQHDLEYEVAETIQSLVPCAERVAYTCSGSEAVQLALRLARAATGRPLILKFEGHYHGWMDSVLWSYKPTAEQVLTGKPSPGSGGQTPNAADNLVVARWNSIEAVEATFDAHEGQIAAVILEPYLCNSGCLAPGEGYLAALRELCTRRGALLIFDEIITGFRMHIGGAQTQYGVTPDMASFGKAIAGGPTLSALTGKAEIFRLLEEGKAAFGGTFNGNPMSMMAAKATLAVLAAEGGKPLADANKLALGIRDGVNAMAQRLGAPLRATGFGCAFALHFTSQEGALTEYRDTLHDDPRRLRRFLQLALDEGQYLLADGRMYTSVVHTATEAEETLAGLEKALVKLGEEEGW
ncbi:MAG: aminotransferase class III-fold pyridoxal phosphate-dependent enzyme [Acidobacteria bacterium]|nr:aminotransferase class III-fold pyridoxal phosphate-dependent enzyme [Acidobacteriota bacterium]